MTNAFLVETIERYIHRFPDETAYVAALRAMIAAGQNVTSRKNFAGHVTAGALLLNDNHYLSIFHAKLQKWLFPGGHLDDDEKPFEAAFRELIEEAGIDRLLIKQNSSWIEAPLDIDHHPIPENVKKAEPAHFHWDFLYVFRLEAPPTVKLDLTEVTSFEWRPVSALPPKLLSRLRADPSMQPFIGG